MVESGNAGLLLREHFGRPRKVASCRSREGFRAFTAGPGVPVTTLRNFGPPQSSIRVPRGIIDDASPEREKKRVRRSKTFRQPSFPSLSISHAGPFSGGPPPPRTFFPGGGSGKSRREKEGIDESGFDSTRADVWIGTKLGASPGTGPRTAGGAWRRGRGPTRVCGLSRISVPPVFTGLADGEGHVPTFWDSPRADPDLAVRLALVSDALKGRCPCLLLAPGTALGPGREAENRGIGRWEAAPSRHVSRVTRIRRGPRSIEGTG
ncbi:hypothetical protein KM043_006126 [Ampulex compressa]|nr:hypothetical protein KM043_006126 [Ampulex compressa]